MIIVTLARKPLSESSVAANVLKHGTGALHIDGARIPAPGETVSSHTQGVAAANRDSKVFGKYAGGLETHQTRGQKIGRWPSNVLLEHRAGCGKGCQESCPANDLDVQGGHSVTGARSAVSRDAVVVGTAWGTNNHQSREYPHERGGASRFFFRFGGGAREADTETG